MQFNNAQMLWALWILIIPVLIHLMRFRRFRKTAFTNVRILQEVLQKSNKGNRIKHWIILSCRLGLLFTLIVALAQPYTALDAQSEPKEIALYLDNSFSMQAPDGGATLLQNAVQGILREFPESLKINLLTNSDSYPRLSLSELRETLLNLTFTTQTLDYQTLFLRLEDLFSNSKQTNYELWMLSDFQKIPPDSLIGFPDAPVKSVVLRPKSRSNISIDSALVIQEQADIQKFEVHVTLDDTTQNAALSFWHKDTLLAKGVPEITGPHSGHLQFSIPASKSLVGYFQVDDQSLSYDNTFYINTSENPKTKVYVVGPGPETYFKKIYSPTEFEYSQSPLMYLDYGKLANQNLLILNELPSLPESFLPVLRNFQESGGSVVIIPAASINLDSYNRILQPLSGITFGNKSLNAELITAISYEHPLFEGVFSGKTQNFEYPSVAQHYSISTKFSTVLGMQNGLPFLAESNGVYVFASALNREISDISESPLIVPTLYNLARYSIAKSRLYYTVGERVDVDLPLHTKGDQIVSLKSHHYHCIPLQQVIGEGVKLNFEEDPLFDGNYQVIQNDQGYGYLSFNYNRDESVPEYPNLKFPKKFEIFEDLEELAQDYRIASEMNELWKWFVIFALLFALAETLLQKFWK